MLKRNCKVQLSIDKNEQELRVRQIQFGKILILISNGNLDSIFVTSDVDTLEAYIPGFLKTGLAKIPTHST